MDLMKTVLRVVTVTLLLIGFFCTPGDSDRPVEQAAEAEGVTEIEITVSSEEEADDLVIRVITPDGHRTIDVGGRRKVSIRKGVKLIMAILAS